MIDVFDTSDYAKDHFLYIEKKVVLKFKVENNGVVPLAWVGLHPKTYSFKNSNNKTKKTAKGVKIC